MRTLAKQPIDDSKTKLQFVEGLKRRWMETVDAIADPLLIVDANLRIQKANKAAALIAGIPVREVIGKLCYKVLAARSTPCPGCPVAAKAGPPPAMTFILEGVLPERIFEVSTQPMLDDHGVREASLQIYRDRTEARRLQVQLLQNEKLASIGLLAGGIAHELNNPLGGILIFSQMILREMATSAPHYTDVVEIEAAAQRCKGIIESLLAFARQQPESGSARAETVSLAESARQALRFARVGGRFHEIEVLEEFATPDLAVMAHPNQLLQPLLNLIQNAFQAMPDGGQLTLRSGIDLPSRSLYIEVEDTGIGIPAERLLKVFDPFFTSKLEGEGTGLGLAICYGIMADLGGSISVRSMPGVGSTFRLSFPEALRSAE